MYVDVSEESTASIFRVKSKLSKLSLLGLSFDLKDDDNTLIRNVGKVHVQKDSNLHTHQCENLKCKVMKLFFGVCTTCYL
jgi:hypothetical protein